MQYIFMAETLIGDVVDFEAIARTVMLADNASVVIESEPLFALGTPRWGGNVSVIEYAHTLTII